MKAFLPWLCLPALAAADLSGLHGPALRAALHSQVRGHTVIPYSSSRFDTAGTVFCRWRLKD